MQLAGNLTQGERIAKDNSKLALSNQQKPVSQSPALNEEVLGIMDGLATHNLHRLGRIIWALPAKIMEKADEFVAMEGGCAENEVEGSVYKIYFIQ